MQLVGDDGFPPSDQLWKYPDMIIKDVKNGILCIDPFVIEITA